MPLNRRRYCYYDRFEALIWTSAKQTVLTAEGIVSRHLVLRTLDDIYTSIAVALQREDITRARPEQQAEMVRHILTQQRTLLIVDNLEIVDDEAVLTFLRELPAPTKAIVTTRHRIDVAYPVRLLGMPWGDAQKLINQEGGKKAVTLSVDEVRHLYDRTGGVPLAIVWSIAQMSFGHGVEAVLTRLGQPTGDIARFCFEGAVERIRSKPAHKLLMALSLFATEANREPLGHIADLPELDRDDGLVELEKLSLVNKQGNRFAMLPLTKLYSLYELESNPSFASKVTEKWATQLTELLESQAGWYWIQDQAVVLREGENFRSLLDWVTAHDDYETALQVIQPSVLYFDYAGRRAEALKLALSAKELAHRYGSKSISAWLSVRSGWILSQQGSHKEALEQIDEGLREYEEIADNSGVCFAKCFLAQTLRHSGKLSEAEKLLEEGVILASRLGYLEGIIIGEFELGKSAREENDWQKAYLHFGAAHNVLSSLEALVDIFSLTIVAIQGNYGTAALKLGKYSEAKEATVQALATLERWRDLGVATNFTARMNIQLAEVEEALENYSVAIYNAGQALVLSNSTRDKKGIEKAKQLLEKLQNRSQKMES